MNEIRKNKVLSKKSFQTNQQKKHACQRRVKRNILMENRKNQVTQIDNTLACLTLLSVAVFNGFGGDLA